MIPTKATLFGLDIRFRAVEKQLEDEKSSIYCSLIIIERKSVYKHAKKSTNDRSGST